jgi:hypothetical protein
MKSSARDVYRRIVQISPAIAVACGAGLIRLTGFFALLVYSSIPTKETYLSVNDPATVSSQLVAGFSVSFAWYCL